MFSLKLDDGAAARRGAGEETRPKAHLPKAGARPHRRLREELPVGVPALAPPRRKTTAFVEQRAPAPIAQAALHRGRRGGAAVLAALVLVVLPRLQQRPGLRQGAGALRGGPGPRPLPGLPAGGRGDPRLRAATSPSRWCARPPPSCCCWPPWAAAARRPRSPAPSSCSRTSPAPGRCRRRRAARTPCWPSRAARGARPSSCWRRPPDRPKRS